MNPLRAAGAALLALPLTIGLAGCQPASTGATSSGATPKAVSAESPSVAKKAPGIGDPLRDGKFQFTVTKVKTGVHRIGSTDFGKSAQGQFVVINLTVKNIGKSAQDLDGSAQYAYDASGKKYEFDTDAILYLPNSNSFFVSVNPGNSLKGQLVFDVPKSTKLTKLKLHDSAFSGGVSVALR